MKALRFAVIALLAPQVAHSRPSHAKDEIGALTKTVAGQGKSRFTAHLSGMKVTVDIFTRTQTGNRIASGRVSACTGARVPCSLVDDISIRVGLARVHVPHAILLRLADIDRAGIATRAANKFELVLECGDASEAYTARILFDRRRGRQIDIYDDEAGALAERTVYYDLSRAFDR